MKITSYKAKTRSVDTLGPMAHGHGKRLPTCKVYLKDGSGDRTGYKCLQVCKYSTLKIEIVCLFVGCLVNVSETC